MEELPGDGFRRVADSRAVRIRMGKKKKMIKENGCKDSSRQKESDGPSSWDRITASFQVTCKDDEPALGGDHGNAIKNSSYSDKGGLERLREPEHVKTVSSGVMGCRAESHQPEEGKGILEEPGLRDAERNARKRRSNEELHQKDPVALRPEEFEKRAPERLDDPGKVEPARIKGDVGVRDAKALIEDD